jgi:sugar phosphate isomerase/epimerase
MIVSAFADEIASDVAVQLAVLRRHGVSHVDLRAVDGSNIIELSDAQHVALRERFRAHGVAVAAIASPIGKEPADSNPAALRGRLTRAAAIARLFDTDLIRVFGFYQPGDGADWTAASLRSLRTLASCAREEGVTLLLENEAGTCADTAEHAGELLAALAGEPVCAAFDPANALRCGDTPYPDGYARLKPWLREVHVKDLDEHGEVVPAGFGTADWPALFQALRRDDYEGFISLEPHLLRAGRAGGFTGPTLFAEAHRALQTLITSNGTHLSKSIPPEKRRSIPLTLKTIETPTASVFWAKGGVLKTAALEDGILPSTTRVVLMEALETQAVSATLDEIRGADEVFLASTSGEIQPVRRLDDVEYEEAPGPLCRAAWRTLDQAIAREAASADDQR